MQVLLRADGRDIRARLGHWLATAAIVFVLVFFVLVTLAPVYWMVSASFRPQSELFSLDFSLLPRSPTIKNYEDLFARTQFPRWLLNSIVVTLASTVLGVGMGSMAGFAFAKYEFRMKSFLFWLALASVSIPQIVTIIPIFTWFSRIGLTDTYFVLAVPPAVNVFAVFLLRQYIQGLSDDMLESARIDGASEWGVFSKIVLPLVRPGLGAAAIFLWVGSWSAYMWPLVMVQSNALFTLPLGLATLYSNPWDLNYGMLMAGSVLATIPITVAFLLMQEQFISGLTQGAVKG